VEPQGPVRVAPKLATSARPTLARSSQRSGLLRGERALGVDPNVAVEKGARVQVLRGPFEGKVGLVQEVDPKGGARVMLGLLALRLDVKDLAVVVEGRERRVLSTSHRRPLPIRS
jgi:transcription antitermination factor NusG